MYIQAWFQIKIYLEMYEDKRITPFGEIILKFCSIQRFILKLWLVAKLFVAPVKEIYPPHIYSLHPFKSIRFSLSKEINMIENYATKIIFT